MMKKIVSMLLCALLLCAAAMPALAEAPENPYYREYEQNFIWSTKDISKLKSKAAKQQGTVESITYQTPAYAINAVMGTDYVVEKTANVYLPYGYDPAQSYNVLYLMHGGGDNQDYWLIERDTRTHGKTTTRVVDHMIEDGLCGQVIIVTPTFYTRVEGVEMDREKAQAVRDSIGPINDLDTWFFGQEFRNNLIPAVESKYATYAKGDVSEANLIATRDHRAYCGLSMGSITSFHGILMQNFDLIGWCGSWSGALTNEELFRTKITENFADYKMNFWYNGNGTQDQAFEEHYALYNQLMETMPEKFVDGQNSAFVTFPDGGHNYAAWIADLYNCLLVFFK